MTILLCVVIAIVAFVIGVAVGATLALIAGIPEEKAVDPHGPRPFRY